MLMAVNDEYPVKPWIVNPPFEDPKIIKTVAVISKQIPRVMKISRVVLIIFFFVVR